MTEHKGILTVAGEFRVRAAKSGLDQLPVKEQNLCVLMFFAGFAAMLEKNLEIADLPPMEALRTFNALQQEIERFEEVVRTALQGLAASDAASVIEKIMAESKGNSNGR